MPARVTQPAGYPAGEAQVQVVGVGAADLGSLEVCISGMLDTVEKHLDPRLSADAWTTAYAWFRPAAPRADGPALLFDLAPAVTWHLRPHAPYVLRLRDAQGLRREERLTWVAIRLPSQAPQGYLPPAGPAPQARAADAVAKAPTGDVEAAADREARAAAEHEALAAARTAAQRRQEEGEQRRQDEADQRRRAQDEALQQRTDGRGRSKALVGGVAALLLAAGLAAYVFKDDLFDASAPPAVVAPSVPTTLDGARQFLARNPGADESFGLATRFLKEKQLDGAFLLLRNAAGKGNAAAALALGEMYDPDTYSAETSPLPAPNATQAAEWYRQAAEAGVAEAQYRYGLLLTSGKTAEPNGPELGVAWLRKAADQGHAKAKDALPK